MVLKKGLSFVPFNHFNLFKWVKDIFLFARKIHWKKLFSSRDKRESDQLGIPTDLLRDIRLLYSLSERSLGQDGQGPFTTLKEQKYTVTSDW